MVSEPIFFEAAGRVRMEEAITCDGVPCFELVCKPIKLFAEQFFVLRIICPRPIQASPISRRRNFREHFRYRS